MATEDRYCSNCGFDREPERKMQEDRETLRKHLLPLAPEEQVKGWDDMWRKNVTPWDRNQPNPALVDTLHDKAHIFGSPFKDENAKGIRKKALVPGCGRGYDVLLFSSYGFDAYGLDASQTAIQEAGKLLQEQGKEQQYPLKNIQNGRGSAQFIVADFFKDDFQAQTHLDNPDRTFDLIYDYTFLCALPPVLRPRWAARMSQLLSPSGHLICVEYPLGKDPKTGGPPHGLQHVLYEQLFAKPGREVVYNDSGHVCEDRSGNQADNALVRIESWVPERTFDSQKGQIKVSIWRRWKA